MMFNVASTHGELLLGMAQGISSSQAAIKAGMGSKTNTNNVLGVLAMASTSSGGFADQSSARLATSYAESNGNGWVDQWGNVYPPSTSFNNPELGLEGVYPEALLPIGKAAQGTIRAGEIAATSLGKFLGPKGPVFGTSFFRGRGNSGLLNHGNVRMGWSYNSKTDKLNFSLRIGKWHSDKYFNPISIRAPD